MTFTDGPDLEFELLMRRTPGFDRRSPIRTPSAVTQVYRECLRCMYSGEKSARCRWYFCPVFEDQPHTKGAVCPFDST